MFLSRVSRCVSTVAVLASVGCIAKRETSELFLRGSIAESSEVVQLDPVFLSRQRQVESRFFGFDDQAAAGEGQWPGRHRRANDRVCF